MLTRLAPFLCLLSGCASLTLPGQVPDTMQSHTVVAVIQLAKNVAINNCAALAKVDSTVACRIDPNMSTSQQNQVIQTCFVASMAEVVAARHTALFCPSEKKP